VTINSTIAGSVALHPIPPFDTTTASTPVGIAVHASFLLTVLPEALVAPCARSPRAGTP